jgi:hypothetical protein
MHGGSKEDSGINCGVALCVRRGSPSRRQPPPPPPRREIQRGRWCCLRRRVPLGRGSRTLPSRKTRVEGGVNTRVKGRRVHDVADAVDRRDPLAPGDGRRDDGRRCCCCKHRRTQQQREGGQRCRRRWSRRRHWRAPAAVRRPRPRRSLCHPVGSCAWGAAEAHGRGQRRAGRVWDAAKAHGTDVGGSPRSHVMFPAARRQARRNGVPACASLPPIESHQGTPHPPAERPRVRNAAAPP